MGNNTGELIGKGRGFIYCEECGKLLGVSYALEDGEYVDSDCFCIECHNPHAVEKK